MIPLGRLSAVLIPFHYDQAGMLHVSVIRRAPGGLHGGQLAFPGGKHDDTDETLLETALRETEEEVGLNRSEIEVVQGLTPIHTIHTGYTIYPFVGLVKNLPDNWIIEEAEVQEVLTVSVDRLIEGKGHHLFHLPDSKEPSKFPCYYIDTHPLWGASYRMIKPLLEQYQNGMLKLTSTD